MDGNKRRTVQKEVHPTGARRPSNIRPIGSGETRRTIRSPEQPRTTAKTNRRQRERTEERAAMKIKERKVSPTPVRRKHTPAKPEMYSEREKPKRTVPPGTTVRKTDAERRRAGYEKMRRRRRTALVIGVLTVLVLISVAAVFAVRTLFKVQTVTVTGTTRYDPEDIRVAAGFTTEDNLLFLPEEKAMNAVDDLFPWIGSVEIKRHFPDKVEICVAEAVPATVFSTGGTYLLVSDAGRILERHTIQPQGYFCVNGLQLASYEPGDDVEIKDETAARAYEEIAAVLQEQNVTRVNYADMTDVYDISLLYDGRITMKLGSPTDLTYKIRFGMKIVEAEGGDGLSSTDRGVLDLSLTRDNNKAYFAPEVVVSQPENSSSEDGSGQEGGVSSALESGGEDDPSASSEDTTSAGE